MRSEHPDTVPHNLPVTAEDHMDPHTDHHVKPDARRFAGIFPLEISEAISVDCSNATYEKHSHNSDGPSRWEFSAALDKGKSTARNASVASADESSTPSAAQQIVACYRAAHGGSHAVEVTTTGIIERRLPRIPHDQRSMYTLAASTDTQTTMDMMWRPQPKVHMHHTDQRALIQAQTQAIVMMHNAGLKPSNKIQCRRRGCADILPDVEALKYHLHIHNIADMAARRNDASPSNACEPSLAECSTSNSKTSKKSHFHSRPSLRIQHGCPTAYSPPRKLSAGALLPFLISPRESTPEVQRIPNLSTVAKPSVPDPSPNEPPTVLPVCGNEMSSTRTSTRFCGRRTRKESKAISVDVKCGPSTTMLLPPPSSPHIQDRYVLGPHTSPSMTPALNPAADGENSDRASVDPVSEKLMRSRSPLRALSPIRAMNPIRNGIKRVLSIGYSVEFTDE